jgi:hypothetical protein
LPVNFKNFYGERIGRVNNLYWETAMEENLKMFSLERSADAENFTEIAKIIPKNVASKYQYEDKTAAPGTLNYYRITSVDLNGDRTSTSIVVLGAQESEIAVSGIYPNPVRSNFIVSIDSKIVTILTLNIYDAFGKLVKSFSHDIGTGVSQYAFNCEDIQPGIYFLETTNSNKEVVAKQKMVKVAE